MSAEAVGWVYRHSPYAGATFQVHLAVADSVNDQHDNEFWLTRGRLAKKARVSPRSAFTALTTLTEGGFLDLLDESSGRTPSRYRFLYPDVPVVYDSRSPSTVQRLHGSKPANRATTDSEPCNQRTSTVQPAHERLPLKEGTQGNPREPKAAGRLRAEGLVKASWESWGREKRALHNFMGLVKLTEKFVEAGTSDDDLHHLLNHAPVTTREAWKLELSRCRNGNGHREPPNRALVMTDREGPGATAVDPWA